MIQKFRSGILMLAVIAISLFLTECKQDSSKVTSQQENNFVNFTDLHFTPYYDKSLINELVKSEHTEWDNIFSKSAIKDYGEYGEEANYPLFNKALLNMKKNIENPDFIIMTGDFICHDFEAKFKKFSGIDSNEEAHKFLDKTIKFVSYKIKQVFGDISVFPALGNNDSYCGDYQLEANGKFLKTFSDIWKKQINSPDMDKIFLQGGYYSATSPVNKKHKIISLNSIFFSVKYNNGNYDRFCDCKITNDYSELSEKQFKWFEEKLKKYSTENCHVWVITHIPPGINIYKTIKESDQHENPKVFTYWKPEYAEKFKNIVSKYSDNIKVIMAGHTHMDDFKIIYQDNSPKSFVHISPAITPVFGNNPGFQSVSYNSTNLSFNNYKTYYVNISEKTDKWKYEYSFSKNYKVKNITATTLDKIYNQMLKDSTVRNNYMKYFPVSSKHSSFIDKSNWNWYNCGIVNVLSEEYLNCRN